jgi:2-iminobutanoate/2-iminopropanoate deaminase
MRPPTSRLMRLNSSSSLSPSPTPPPWLASGPWFHKLAVAVGLLTLAGCVDTSPPAATGGPGAEGHQAAPGISVEAIGTLLAPAAIGPYSQAILAGNTLYLAGQIAMDPSTGEMAQGGIEAETRQVMENLRAVLEAAGSSFRDVVQTQVFLADLADFATMNEIYRSYLSEPYPVRATVQVAALPRGARVEIQMVAVLR